MESDGALAQIKRPGSELTRPGPLVSELVPLPRSRLHRDGVGR